jgi:hypothetical protein
MSVKLKYVFLALIVTALPGWAHHATASQYDISRTISLTGVISKLEWSNPHVHAVLDVKNAHWDVELASPGGVIVAGLSKDQLKPGTVLTVTGYPGKANGSLCAVKVKTPDGAVVTFTVGI